MDNSAGTGLGDIPQEYISKLIGYFLGSGISRKYLVHNDLAPKRGDFPFDGLRRYFPPPFLPDFLNHIFSDTAKSGYCVYKAKMFIEFANNLLLKRAFQSVENSSRGKVDIIIKMFRYQIDD